MKKLLYILGIVGAALIAFLTMNSKRINKAEEKIVELKSERMDLQLKKAVLIDNAKDTKKKTIKSEKDLEKEVTKINDMYGDTMDDLISFIESGKR